MSPVQTGSKLISTTPLLGTSHVGVSGLVYVLDVACMDSTLQFEISAPLKEAGPVHMRSARDASLYNARPLLRDLHTLLDVIQLMSIAGYEAYVCVCWCASSCIKHYVKPSYGSRGTPIVARMCLYCKKRTDIYKRSRDK